MSTSIFEDIIELNEMMTSAEREEAEKLKKKKALENMDNGIRNTSSQKFKDSLAVARGVKFNRLRDTYYNGNGTEKEKKNIVKFGDE